MVEYVDASVVVCTMHRKAKSGVCQKYSAVILRIRSNFQNNGSPKKQKIRPIAKIKESTWFQVTLKVEMVTSKGPYNHRTLVKMCVAVNN